MDYVAMGRRIRHLRTNLEMTQENVAKECGISTAYYGHIERGTRKASVETLVKIAKTLEASLDEIILGTVNGFALPENMTLERHLLTGILRVLHERSDEWLGDLPLKK